MNTTNILSVRFFIKKYKAKNNKAPLYARITVDGKSVDTSLKREIDLVSWNRTKGQAKGTRDEIKSLNSSLDQVRTEISNCYADLKFQKKPINAEAVKNLFCGIIPDEHTLMGLIEYHNTYLKDMVYAKVIEKKVSDDMELLKQKLNAKVLDFGIQDGLHVKLC